MTGSIQNHAKVRSVITLQARLVVDGENKLLLDDLMRRWSSCMRYAYQRLLEGKERKELKKSLQKLFDLNSRYVDDAILWAQSILKLSKELGYDPRKVIFGGRDLFEKLSKKHLSEEERHRLKEEWKERRQCNLYSRGDKSKGGNLNLRVVKDGDRLFLRVNAGNRKWLLLELKTSHKKLWLLEDALQRGLPYSVRLQRKDDRYYAYVSLEEELPPVCVGFENGAIGIDLNAFPSHIAWAEVSKDGNLVSYGEIATPHLWDGRKTKRDYFAWQYAHEVVQLALEKRKGIVLERLSIRDRGFRGDGSRKGRRIKHSFSYRKLIERIKTLARRYGVAVREVSSVYTSIIGMLKYAPQRSLTKDVASSWVIARRGLGYREDIPVHYRTLLISLKREPEAVSLSTDGRKGLTAESLKRSPYNLWQMLKVAVLTALSPEKYPRCFSPLKPLLVSGDVGRTLCGRKFLRPGAGTMAVQIPPAGAGLPEKAGYKYPSPDCFIQSG